jgi:hypothetical protein
VARDEGKKTTWLRPEKKDESAALLPPRAPLTLSLLPFSPAERYQKNSRTFMPPNAPPISVIAFRLEVVWALRTG